MMIEVPLWIVIVYLVVLSLFFIHLLISDFFIKLVMKKYKIELKEREENEKNK